MNYATALNITGVSVDYHVQPVWILSPPQNSHQPVNQSERGPEDEAEVLSIDLSTWPWSQTIRAGAASGPLMVG